MAAENCWPTVRYSVKSFEDSLEANKVYRRMEALVGSCAPHGPVFRFCVWFLQMPGCYWKNGRDWYKLVDKHIIVFVEVCFSSADKCRISFRQEARDPTRTHSSAKQIYEFSVGGFIGYVQSWRVICHCNGCHPFSHASKDASVQQRYGSNSSNFHLKNFLTVNSIK